MATNITTYFRNRPPRAGGGALAPPISEDLVISICASGEAYTPNSDDSYHPTSYQSVATAEGTQKGQKMRQNAALSPLR